MRRPRDGTAVGNIADGASFAARCEPHAEVSRVEAYCEWMKQIGTTVAPDCSYDLHAACHDEANRTAVFFATFHARHTGDGGPVAPTGRETRSGTLPGP